MHNTADTLLDMNNVKPSTTMPNEHSTKLNTIDPPSTISTEREREISSHWEKVNFEPYERKEYEYETLRTEYMQAQESAVQNARGVDVDSKTQQPLGNVEIDSVHVEDFPQNTTTTLYYVSMVLLPSTASNAKTKRHRTLLKERPRWMERVVFDSIKSKKINIQFTLYEHTESEFMADTCLGHTNVTMHQLLDQQQHEIVLPISSLREAKVGILRVRMKFRYDRVRYLASRMETLEAQVCALKETKSIYEHNHAVFQSHVVHPSSLGQQTLQTELYLPGNRFNIHMYHPGAVLRMPFSDKTKVNTPFGKGFVVGYRSLRRLYTIRLDEKKTLGGQLAYVYADQVSEDLDPQSSIQVGSTVETPYGTGQVVDVSASIKVQLDWGIATCRREDVRLPVKKVEDMSEPEKLRQATALTDVGNTCVKDKNYTEAVTMYLQSLGFLQFIDQDSATHKQKAEVLQTMIRCHLNIGACKLKLKAYAESIIASTNAINILNVLENNKEGKVVEWMGRLGMSSQLLFIDWPSKALYRRAQGHLELNAHVLAKKDLKLVVQLVPGHKTARIQLERVVKKLAREKQKEKKAWGGFLESKEEKLMKKKVSTNKCREVEKSTTTRVVPNPRPSKIQPDLSERVLESTPLSLSDWTYTHVAVATTLSLFAATMVLSLSKARND